MAHSVACICNMDLPTTSMSLMNDNGVTESASTVHRGSAATARHRTGIFMARDLGDQRFSCKHQRGDRGSVLEYDAVRR